MSTIRDFFREPTKAQWAALTAAWFGWVLDAFDFTIFLLAMPHIAADFGVTLTATAASITLTLLLRLLGGIAAGAVADRYGAKLPLMISIVWFAACDGAVALAPSFLWVVVLRALFGLGMGAEFTAGATLAMERWPAKTRGIASGVLQGSWAVGYLAASLVAAWVLPRYGYRVLFALAAVPALFVFPIRLWVPNTPPVQRASNDKPAKLGRTVVWACVMMSASFSGYYAMTALYPTLLQKELGLSAQAMGQHVALFNLGMLAGAVACGTLAAKRGAALAIILPAALCVAVLPFYVGMVGDLMPLGAFLGGVFGAGYSGVTPLLLTSLFPPAVRGRAVGLVYHVGAAVAAVVPPVIAALAERKVLPLAEIMAWASGGLQLVVIAVVASRGRPEVG